MNPTFSKTKAEIRQEAARAERNRLLSIASEYAAGMKSLARPSWHLWRRCVACLTRALRWRNPGSLLGSAR